MPWRAFCPSCSDFSVLKTTNKCLHCGSERNRKYEFVPTDQPKHYTEEKQKPAEQNQLGLGFS